MMRLLLLVLVGSLLVPLVSASPSDAFFPLNQAIALLADSPPGESLAKQVEELRVVTQKLEDRFTTAQVTVPEDYEKTLRFDAGLLRAASRNEGGAPAAVLVHGVLEDLRAKDVASQRKGMGAGVGSLSPLIKVNVTTTSKGKEAGGYLVRCNPRRFADVSNAMFVFNKPSSPTSYSMPPGMYVCFAAHEGKVQGRQDVSVGLAGADQEDVTIVLP